MRNRKEYFLLYSDTYWNYQIKTLMKRLNSKLAATIVICGSVLCSSCVGSFGLHSRLVNWNQSIDDNKFVNELAFFALAVVQAYTVSWLADAIILNSIEFWTGSNPMASIGDVKKIQGENGNYLVTTLENGYSIAKEGEDTAMQLVYDQEQNTWNVVADGTSTELLKLNENGTASMNLPNGEDLTVTLDATGVATAREAVMTDTYYFALK